MKKVIAVAVFTAILTACSGGGGSGGSSSNSGASASNNTYKQPETTYYGLSPRLKDSTLFVGGKKIELAKEPEGWRTHTLYNGQTVEFYKQKYTAFGYVVPKKSSSDRINQLYTLSVGVDDSFLYTPDLKFENLPKQGVVTYQGSSYAPNSKGKLSLEADFSIKTISGRIYDQKAFYGDNNPADIQLLKTDIKKILSPNNYEAHFAGKAVNGSDNLGYAGKFAGPKAEEVIGIVSDSSTLKTGFIGKKSN